MSTITDVIVIGSGPAGVSVSYPLMEAGLQVLMIDGGAQPQLPYPDTNFLDWRRDSAQQWRWMVGDDFHAMRMIDSVSPKLRVPVHRSVFAGFDEANQVQAHNAIAVGSLASGGLSNAWGCGVAALSATELAAFPFQRDALQNAYAKIARRMGLSGAVDDDLSSYFGVDSWAQPPIEMDELQKRAMLNYAKYRKALGQHGFRLGRSRLAALSRDLGTRQACNLSGNCLYGCSRRALYSASEDLADLQRLPGFVHRPGQVAQSIGKDAISPWVIVYSNGQNQQLRARKLVLAAGTLASTRLALHALKLERAIDLQCCPTAAFMLWRPLALGQARTPGFGLGQLSFVQKVQEMNGFGSLFSPTGIPVAEFIRHMPLNRRTATDCLSSLLTSCLIGNLFLPGHLSATRVQLDARGTLHMRGGYEERVGSLMRKAEKQLRWAFLRLGFLLLPRSFTVGAPGSDIHYAASLPMRHDPVRGETDANGALMGVDDVHVVDGACLPSLSEKSHTLTIMANAHRIGQQISKELNQSNASS